MTAAIRTHYGTITPACGAASSKLTEDPFKVDCKNCAKSVTNIVLGEPLTKTQRFRKTMDQLIAEVRRKKAEAKVSE